MWPLFMSLLKTIFKKSMFYRKVSIDNFVFRLHYQLSFAFLMAYSIVVSLNQYVGDPIDCLGSGSTAAMDKDTLDAWCYIKGIYTVQPECVKLAYADRKIYAVAPGVISYTGREEIKTYPYYLWIGLILFVQALFFYIPHYLWKSWESGHLEMLVGDFAKHGGSQLVDEVKGPRTQLITNYLLGNLGHYNLYYLVYSISECLNLLNSILQLFVLNNIFGYGFLSFGYDLLHHSRNSTQRGDDSVGGNSKCQGEALSRISPLDLYFPLMTKCKYEMTGPSGQLVTYDALCTLTVNSYNQKIYIFVWFWLIFISLITLIAVAFRFITFFHSSIRYNLLKNKNKLEASDHDRVRVLVNNIKIGDWFILYQLSGSINPGIFKEILHNLTDKIQERKNC